MEKKFYNKDGKEIQRTPCQVYTRVMGYLRPVSFYNLGKKSEFYSRKYYSPDKACKRDFTNNDTIINNMINTNKNFISQYS